MTNEELEEVICGLHRRIALTTAGTPLQDDLIKVVGALRIAVNRIAELEAQMPKKGEWIFEKGDGTTCVDGWICTACRKSFHTHVPYFDEFRYCPNCGAKMDGKEKDE